MFQVTETFTPPPPSNWGLPDDGRVYSYGTFPSLKPDLFGKVRPPRTWRGRRSSLRLSRRTSVRTAASEQVVFAKAMVPAMRSTSTLLAVTKRGAKSLEQAIAALSNQFNSSVINGSTHSQGSLDRLSVISEVTVPSELGMTEDIVTSAEEVVLNHRRKQAILLGIFITFQTACRTRYCKQQPSKDASMTEMQMTSSESESLQATKEYFAAATIQASARRTLARLYYQRARSGAALMQAVRRGRSSRFAYRLVRITVIRAQCASRGYLARLRLRTVISGRLALYRQHLVQLWKSTNTSLCYRSVFWSCIRKEKLVQLAFTEDEIRRLWGELRMEPPAFATELDKPMLADDVRLRVYINRKLNPSRAEETTMTSAANLGISNKQYVQTLLVRMLCALQTIESVLLHLSLRL
jgi:DENN domain-containing protein 5